MYKSTYVFSYLSIIARILLLIYILNLKEEKEINMDQFVYDSLNNE